MTPVATHAGTTLQLTRVFAAPRERVFRAWTDPEQFRQWFTPPRGSAPRAEMDVRVGGLYRIAMQPRVGGMMHAVGSYVEVEPPERLVYTLAWQGVPFDSFGRGETLVTVEFHNRGDSTEVVLTHERFTTRRSRAFHRWGWKSSLEALGDVLHAGAAAPAM